MVIFYDTGKPALGIASDELVAASAAATPTGAVCACRDKRMVWHPIDPSDAAHYRDMHGYLVETVYVESVYVESV